MHLCDHGFSELGEGRLEAIYVAEVLAGELRPVGQVRFGFAGKGLWPACTPVRGRAAAISRRGPG